MEIDEKELTILAGRLEIIPKLKKIELILQHRNDKARLAFVGSLLSRVEKIRPDRNAITHGVYKGKSKSGEYFFLLTADLLFEEERATAYKFRPFTHPMLSQHIRDTVAIATDLPQHFDVAKMLKLHSGQFRVPKQFLVDPNPNPTS